MGNILVGKKKAVMILKVDGSTLKLKPPANAAGVLQDHPGYTLLESAEVKELGVRANPLPPDAPLNPASLYFLVQLPKLAPDQRGPRASWSGALHVSAKERLERLMLMRRTMSDVALPSKQPRVEATSTSTSTTAAADEGNKDGAVRRLRMRLPKSQVDKVMQESQDAAEAAERIMELCAAKDPGGAGVLRSQESTTAVVRKGRPKEKRARFTTAPEEIIV